MTADESIVKPGRSKIASDLGPVAVMVSSKDDLFLLCSRLQLDKNKFKNIFTSRLYITGADQPGLAVVGPVIGAPYAVILLENLIAWGASKIIFFGWCGTISPTVKIGDIIVPNGAIIDEGTSRHYLIDDDKPVRPSHRLLEKTRQTLEKAGLDFHEGLVWSTDAIYRETRPKVEGFQKQKALAVEMELSALFTVARYRGIEAAAILVVSDDVSTFTWRPGFKASGFIESRKAVAEVIGALCSSL
ncbi:MAG: nucleoside phosphorylase [Proteobacteria bacterium]|nr:nucleoside phosphorylase [Pseudomonadota bacterium]